VSALSWCSPLLSLSHDHHVANDDEDRLLRCLSAAEAKGRGDCDVEDGDSDGVKVGGDDNAGLLSLYPHHTHTHTHTHARTSHEDHNIYSCRPQSKTLVSLVAGDVQLQAYD